MENLNRNNDLLTIGPDIRVADIVSLAQFLADNFESSRPVICCITESVHHTVLHLRRDSQGRARLIMDGTVQKFS